MSVVNFIKKEFIGFKKSELIIFISALLVIASIAFYMKDTPVAIASAIFGICATILAGKGKISCYVFGIAANICYSYISYKNQFWGHLALNALYYFPMQFVGIANWRNHLKKETQDIYKTRLPLKQRFLYGAFAILFTIIGYFILKYYGDSNPFMDSFTTIFSIMAYLLTVKRCIEQWYFWTIVNAMSVIMWIGAYISGSHCFATILMWGTYLILGLYFLQMWNKEIKK